MVQHFHDDMQARVQDNSETSKPFPVSNRVKQGCVLAQTLFSYTLSAILTDTFRDSNVGIRIKYHWQAVQPHASGKNQGPNKYHQGLSADVNCVSNAGSAADMQPALTSSLLLAQTLA